MRVDSWCLMQETLLLVRRGMERCQLGLIFFICVCKTFYLEILQPLHHNLNTIIKLTQDLSHSTTDKIILLAITLPNQWESTPEAQARQAIWHLNNIHKIAHFAPNTIHTYSTDQLGQTHKSHMAIKDTLTLWLIHTPHTTIQHYSTRTKYFSHLKRLKREHRSLNYHPAFDYSDHYPTKQLKCHTHSIKELIDHRSDLLQKSPIDWDQYHILSSKKKDPYCTSTHSYQPP